MALQFPSPTPVQVVRPPVSEPLVVPVVGPPGPPGPQGAPGDAGGALGYRHIQSSPSTLVQAVHNLPFKPAGIICTETDGFILEYETVTHPAAGVTEVFFGVPFSGTIDLS